MRVAYFTESLYPLVDGVSRTLARLFATLEERSIDFRVYSPFVPDKSVPWSGRVRRSGYVHFPPYPDYRISLPYTRGVLDDARSFEPDLVHVVSPTPMGLRATRIARSLGVPAVTSFHTHFVSYFRYYGVGPLEPFGWWMMKSFYGRFEKVYAPSESIIRELGEHQIDNVELWSRGIDLTLFSPANRSPETVKAAGGDDSTPVLLLVSRLVKEKDLLDLVEVDRILRERGVRFAFAFVGDGPLRSKLEQALPAAVFAGHQSGKDLARWYASADVFIFPSTTETLGNVVLEALASALPSVVVDRGGPQDLIDHGANGFVARANDPADIAGYLQRLLQDRELRTRMALSARESASSRSWSEVNGGLIESYRRVIAAGRGRARDA